MRTWWIVGASSRGLIGTLTLPEMLLMTAMSIAREKEEGTFDQLLVTPFRPAELMIGKALPSLLVFLSQATGLSAGRSALVSDSFRRVVPHALFWPYLVSFGGDRNRTPAFVAGRDHAASTALVFLAGDAAHALVRGLHLTRASMPEAIQDFDLINPLTLHDRYIATGVPRRRRRGSAYFRFVAAGADSAGYALYRCIGIPPSIRMKK